MGFFKKKGGKRASAGGNKPIPKVGVEFKRDVYKIEDVYKVGKELGTGGFAVVKLGTCNENNTPWALKMIKMDTYKKNKVATDAEVTVMRDVKHEGIVNIREVVQTQKYFVIVMELLDGGELFEQIVQKEKYNEDDAKDVTRTILTTVGYLHSQKCVHRDLKPENLIFANAGGVGGAEPNGLKITDFGFASMFEESGKLTQSCGTPEYVAPEILQDKPYGEQCDIWSVGVIVYILLCGFPPFYADDDEELFDKIGKADFEFVPPYWDDISQKGKEFVTRMLTVNPDKRPTAAEALQDPWLTSGEKGKDLSAAKEAIARFNATRKLRKAVIAVIAMNRFKTAFEKIGQS